MSVLTDKVKKLLHGSGATSVRPAKEITALLRHGALLLDVRTVLETRKGIAPGAMKISLLRLKRRLSELPKDRTIVTYCASGERAAKARDILEAAGFQAVNGGGHAGILKILKGLRERAR